MTEEKKEDDEEDCEACNVGVILGITKYVCDDQGPENKKSCDELYEKVVMGELKVSEFVAEVKKKVKDPMDLKTLTSVEEVLKDYGFE